MVCDICIERKVMGMDIIAIAIAVLVSVVVGGVVGFLAKIGIIGMRKKKAADDVTRMLDEAELYPDA